jgi:hypothetical protein
MRARNRLHRVYLPQSRPCQDVERICLSRRGAQGIQRIHAAHDECERREESAKRRADPGSSEWTRSATRICAADPASVYQGRLTSSRRVYAGNLSGHACAESGPSKFTARSTATSQRAISGASARSFGAASAGREVSGVLVAKRCIEIEPALAATPASVRAKEQKLLEDDC